MKHLVNIQTGDVLMSGIPDTFTNSAGFTTKGRYKQRTDLHYADGWRDEEKPPIDPDLEQYGQPYFDADMDKVVFPVVEKSLPVLGDLQKQKIAEFLPIMNDFTTLISQAKLNYPDSTDLDTAIATIRAMKDQTISAINAFTDVKLLVKFKFRSEDIEAMKDLLKPFLL